MKRLINLLALLFLGWQVHAQLFIGSGATVSSTGIAVITLSDGDFINNGTFDGGTSDFHFVNNNGNDLSISGTGDTNLDWMFVETGGQDLILEQEIDAVGVNFVSGHFDLNGNNVNLLDLIVDEDETRSFIGPNGGAIVYQISLNSPTGANPGNMGAEITSAANLGEVTIRRSHQPAMSNGVESIERQYDISPANNMGLDATLRFYYLQNELNGLDENELELWRNEGAGWDLAGTTSSDPSANWLELTGIDSFSDWTAAESDFTPVLEMVSGELIQVGRLFPNPVEKGAQNIQLPITNPANISVQLRIIDNLGRVAALNEFYLASGENILLANIAHLSSGLYHLQLLVEGQQLNQKFIVK